MAAIRNGIIIFLLSSLGVSSSFAQVPRSNGDGLEEREMEVEELGQSLFALKNNPLLLPCGVRTRLPVLDFWWLKDGAQLDNSTRVKYSGLDLSFERVVEKVGPNVSDQGTYRCAVKISLGVVLGPPHALFIVVLENNPEVSLSLEGFLAQNIILPCPVRSVPAGTVRWINSHIGGSRFNQLSNGDLLIENLGTEDAGIWRCEVRNPVLNEVKQSSVILVVNLNESVYGPEILDTFPTDLLLDSETLDFYCLANGNPRPSATWIRFYELETDDPTHFDPQEISLGPVIRLNKENGSSTHTCVASVGAISVQKSLNAAPPPSFPNSPTLKYPPAKTVRIECTSPGGPVIWYKDGLVLQINKGRIKSRNTELVISNTIRNDSGFYQCESGNFIGTSRLIVDSGRKEPDPPAGVTCDHLTSRAIKVSWNRDNAKNIQAFTLHITPVDGGEERQAVTNNTAFQLNNLLPNTNYSIYLRSYSGQSASAQSAKVYCSTLEDYPIRGPRLILPNQVGPPSQFHLKWKTLTNDEARGKIIFYKLQWRTAEGSFSHVLHLSGDAREFIITELEPSTLYSVRLLPATSNGYSPQAEGFAWTNFETMPVSNLTFDPPHLYLATVNSTQMLVSWDWGSATESQNIDGYRLFIGEENRTMGHTVYHPPLYLDKESSLYTLSNLQPSTQYLVSLQAFSENWESLLVTKLVTKDEFYPISGLEAQPQSSTEILLEWRRPDVDHVDNYTVKYNAVGLSEVKDIMRDGRNESLRIGNLAPYQSYEFVVTYKSNGIEAPFSQKVEAKTKEGVPDPPVAIQFDVVNNSCIRLSWTPPITTNGIIRQYFVELTNDSAPEKVPFFIRTNRTEVVVVELEKNKNYLVRVSAETEGGRGEFSKTIVLKIFNKNWDDSNNMSQDSPLNNTSHGFSESRHLGLILGTSLGLLSIFICGTIIVFRNRCFPFLLRREENPAIGTYMNGRRGKDTVDGPPVEMELLRSTTDPLYHLDTKGGHPNGLIPNGVSQPLLSPVDQNPDEESRQLASD